MQHAAARSVPVPKVNLSGAGMTKMLSAEPCRIGEFGPSVEQLNPQVKFPYGKSLGLVDKGFPASSCVHGVVELR